MSLLSYLFDEDYFQDSDLDDLCADPDEVSVTDVSEIATEVPPAPSPPTLEARVGQLNLAVEALVRVIVSHGIAKPKELAELMHQIDSEDGEQDGEFNAHRAGVPKWCPDCEARIPEEKTYCVFCGQQFSGEPPGLLNRIDDYGRKLNRNFPPESCPTCDARVPDGQPFCKYCGERFDMVGV